LAYAVLFRCMQKSAAPADIRPLESSEISGNYHLGLGSRLLARISHRV
jgi:hypothetical protein